MRELDRSQAAALALLGLGEGASRAQVVRAWRRAAREVHPDRSAAPDAAGRFAELCAAYAVARAATEEHSPAARPPGGRATESVPGPAARPAARPMPPPQRLPRRGVPVNDPLRRASPPLVAGPVVVEPWPSDAPTSAPRERR